MTVASHNTDELSELQAIRAGLAKQREEMRAAREELNSQCSIARSVRRGRAEADVQDYWSGHGLDQLARADELQRRTGGWLSHEKKIGYDAALERVQAEEFERAKRATAAQQKGSRFRLLAQRNVGLLGNLAGQTRRSVQHGGARSVQQAVEQALKRQRQPPPLQPSRTSRTELRKLAQPPPRPCGFGSSAVRITRTAGPTRCNRPMEMEPSAGCMTPVTPTERNASLRAATRRRRADATSTPPMVWEAMTPKLPPISPVLAPAH